ncbi:MAG: copper amine oxidase N-terminal domain-containing protein, partial [Defluviitaleaceae bacterium]|nr:copper amine oxidase N-terminal domain-containing protein [Defluviitaleaceae bacterium]
MKQKFVSRAIAFAVGFSLVLSMLVPMAVPAAETVVFSLANYISAHGLTVGDYLPDISEETGLSVAGSGRVTVTANNSLFVELDGSDVWRGMDLNIEQLGIQAGDQVTVSIRRPAGVPANARIVLRSGKTNYDQPSWAVSPALNAGDVHTFTIGITPAHIVTAIPGAWALNDPETIRIRHEQDTNVASDFYVTDIKITRGGTAVSQTPQRPVFEGGVIYSFLDDPDAAKMVQGSTFIDSDISVFAKTSGGNHSITVVPNPYGGNALRFTDRTNEWDGVDFLWRELGLENGTYDIKVVGNVEFTGSFAPDFALAGSSSPWAWLGEEEFPDDATGDFEMIRTFMIQGGEVHSEYAGAIGGNIRMRPPEVRNSYSIYQVVVVPSGVKMPALPARRSVPAPTPAPTPTPPPQTGTTIQLTIDSTTATVNGTARTLDAAPFITGGRTMV